MSDPLLPFETWNSGITTPSIPFNNNVRRAEILSRPVISATTDAQPVSPAEGDVYVITGAASGTQWATFDEDDIAIYFGGTWTAYAPPDGLRKYVADEDEDWQFETGTGWAAAGGGGSDRSTVSALATSGSVAIDYALGDYFTLALAGNVSGFTFSNLPGAGKGATLMIRITQDATPRTVAWPASFRWAGGVSGVVSTSAGAVDVLAITTFDNGTTWRATLAKAFA